MNKNIVRNKVLKLFYEFSKQYIKSCNILIMSG